jgi:predicted small metal-binding protein
MLSLAIDENGDPCRYMAKADTEQEVLTEMSQHLKSIHDVDPAELVANIKGVMKTTRT